MTLAAAAAQAEVHLLGPVEIRRADLGVVAVGGPVSRLLMAQCLLANGRTVHDHLLVDGIWGEHPPPTVAAALRVHASKLRVAIAPLGWSLRRQHAGYALNAPGISVDAFELDDLEADARNADPALALAAVDAALGLWTGPTVADLRKFPFGEQWAAQMDGRRDQLVDRRCRLMIETGHAGDVVPVLQQLVQLTPLDENRWSMLATALDTTGRTAQALTTLDRARRVLRDEAGLDPGPNLRELRQRILVGKDRAAGPAPPVRIAQPPSDVGRGRAVLALPASLGARRPRRLIGREVEIDVLDAALARIRQSRTSVVLRLCGPSGVGKSALAADFAHRAAAGGARIAHGWADQEAIRALGMFADALRLAGAATGGEPRLRVVPPFDPQTGPAVAGWSGERDKAVAVIRSALTDLPDGRPLVVVLDDVQWGDEISIGVLTSLVRHPVAGPVLILATERDAAPSRLDDLGIPVLRVGPLGAPAMHDWCAGRVDGERLARVTGGLPLLVDEVLGRLDAGSSWTDVSEYAGDTLLVARATELGPATLDVVRTAAVLGAEFGVDQLLSLTDEPEIDVLERLDKAIRGGLLNYDRDVPGVLRFAHEELRAACLRRMSPLDLMSRHRDVLRKAPDLDPRRAVHHALQAGRLVPAPDLARTGQRAVDDLLSALEFTEAVRIGSAVLARCGPRADPEPRSALLVGLAKAQAALGNGDRARTFLVDARRAAHTSRSPVAEADVLLAESLLGHEYGVDAVHSARLTRLLADLPESESELRLQLLRQSLFDHLNEGRLDEAATALSAADALAHRIGSADAIAALLPLSHWLWDVSADVERRRAVAHQAARLTRLDADSPHTGGLLAIQLTEALHAGDHATVESTARRIVELGQRSADRHLEWLGRAASVVPPFLAGDFALAQQLCVSAADHARRAGLIGIEEASNAQAFAIAWATGHLPDLVGAGLADTQGGPSFVWQATVGLAMAESGQTAAADAILADLRSTLPGAESNWLNFIGICLATEAAWATGNRTFLAATVPVLTGRIGDHVLLGIGILDLGPVRRFLALALAGAGRAAEAIDHLDRVAADPGAGLIWAQRAQRQAASVRESAAGPTTDG